MIKSEIIFSLLCIYLFYCVFSCQNEDNFKKPIEPENPTDVLPDTQSIRYVKVKVSSANGDFKYTHLGEFVIY